MKRAINTGRKGQAMQARKALFTALLFLGLTGSTVKAVEIMLPMVYTECTDVTGWLMSEKLDGVRGYWDGRQLLSKNGIPFHVPPAFTRNFPDFAIEGELWGGRNTFEKTVGIVKKQEAHDGWLELTFAIFDVPAAPGGVEDRLKQAADWFARHPSDHAFVIDQRPVDSHAHLAETLKQIEAQGGEGIMLRRRGSAYSPGRSQDLLKVKSFSDREAVVVGHLAGQGRNQGRMGSLLVELPDNRTRFKIGTGFSDAIRENPPPVGSLITFKYYGFYPSGIPKFPSFIRIRERF
jgi:DNA ligase-1